MHTPEPSRTPTCRSLPCRCSALHPHSTFRPARPAPRPPRTPPARPYLLPLIVRADGRPLLAEVELRLVLPRRQSLVIVGILHHECQLRASEHARQLGGALARLLHHIHLGLACGRSSGWWARERFLCFGAGADVRCGAVAACARDAARLASEGTWAPATPCLIVLRRHRPEPARPHRIPAALLNRPLPFKSCFWPRPSVSARQAEGRSA